MVHWQQLHFSDFTWSNVLKLVPKVVKCHFTQTEWGFVLSSSDDDTACIERYPTQITGSKTNRLPLTKELMKTLILMVEFGAARSLGHDDTDMSLFLEALEDVHEIHRLVSYQQQKAYFSIRL